MIFYENRLLADDSQEISYLFFLKIKEDVCSSGDWHFMGKQYVTILLHPILSGSFGPLLHLGCEESHKNKGTKIFQHCTCPAGRVI